MMENQSSESNQSDQSVSHLTIGRLRRAAVAVSCLLMLLMAYGCVSNALVARTDKKAERDPATGVRPGAEEYWAGPQDADRVVLFVHGFIGGSNNFNELPARVAEEGWRVRALRLPGHGTSPQEFRETEADELVEYVLAEARALNDQYETVVLAGHSMGCSLSTIAASEGLADGLIFGAPYYGIRYRWYYGLPLPWWTHAIRPVVPWLYKGDMFVQAEHEDIKGEIFSYEWVPTRGLITLMKIGKRAKDPAVLEKVDCPVIMFAAKGDDAASPQAARKVFEQLPGAKHPASAFVLLENSNHHVFWDFDHEELEEKSLEFLEKIEAGE